MRENRTCGSEGGEAQSLPYPYPDTIRGYGLAPLGVPASERRLRSAGFLAGIINTLAERLLNLTPKLKTPALLIEYSCNQFLIYFSISYRQKAYT